MERRASITASAAKGPFSHAEQSSVARFNNFRILLQVPAELISIGTLQVHDGTVKILYTGLHVRDDVSEVPYKIDQELALVARAADS